MFFLGGLKILKKNKTYLSWFYSISDKLHGDEMVDSDGEVVEIHPFMRPPSVRGPYTGKTRGRPRTRPLNNNSGTIFIQPHTNAVICGECNQLLSDTSELPDHMLHVHGIQVCVWSVFMVNGL